MENDTIKYIFVSLICLGFLIGFGYFHELAHQEIFKSYDIESEIYLLKGFPDMITVAERGCPPNTDCKLAHNINEIVGYHLAIIFAFMLIAFVIMYLEKLKRTN